MAHAYQISNRLMLPASSGDRFHMELTEVRLASSTVGLLSFDAGARVVTGATSGFHVNLTLQGQAAGAGNGAEPTTALAGEGLAYEPGAVTDAHWSCGSRVMTLLLSPQIVERELESLLGHSLRAPLRPEPKVEAGGLAQALTPAVHLVLLQLDRPSPASVLTTVQRHVEALIVDGFLLAHRHNYSDELDRPGRAAPRTPIEAAAQLLEERPEHPWTSITLAGEVHLSVRALQDGFKRHYDRPPMAYLRHLRLRRVNAVLVAAWPGEKTVQEVALRHGILHLGRFSQTYRQEFGESPSATLARPAS
ncbi:AraC family transcriptional regulator [Myroides odoratimimus subsp. xuanwuensis]